MKLNLKKLILANPELNRNAKLELSNVKLILMPLVISLILFLSYFAQNPFNTDADKLSFVIVVANFLFTLLVMIWGSKQAADSVIDEVNARTWDNQRMTALSPIEMSIGKLIGSTIYTWYGGLICLAISFLLQIYLIGKYPNYHLTGIGSVFSWFLNEISRFSNVQSEYPIIKLTVNTLNSIISGLVAHSLIISISLMAVQKHRFKRKISSIVYFLVGGALAYYILTSQTFLLISTNLSNQDTFNSAKWFMISMNMDLAIFISYCFILFWSLVGLNNSFRTEFKYENKINTWFVFLLCASIFYMGFLGNVNFHNFLGISHIMTSAVLLLFGLFGVLLVSSYLFVFLQSKDILNIKHLIEAFQTKNYNRVSELIPIWVPNIILMLFSGLILAFFVSIIDQKSLLNTFDGEQISGLFFIQLILFTLRDILMVYYINFSKTFRSPELVAMVFLFLMYMIFPITLLASNNQGILTSIFFPNPLLGLEGMLIPAIEVALVFYLVYSKYEKFRIKHNEIAGK